MDAACEDGDSCPPDDDVVGRRDLLLEIQKLKEENKAMKEQLAENQKESLGMEAVLTCLRDKLDISIVLTLSLTIMVTKMYYPQRKAAGGKRKSSFKSIEGMLASGTRSSTAVLFAKPFSETPRITAWVSQMNSNSTIHKIPQSSISNVSRTGFQVIPGPDWESEFHVDWLAFAQPVVDGKLAGLIQLIEASPATLTPELERNISSCLARPGGVDQADMTGTTLLHAAGHSGNLPLVKWLLGKGANLESADKHGWTPLLSALSNGHTDVGFR
ncbi:hypothetical protein Pelo_17927 [Pelomyxa schiedti]|nr:hypothetical protein Pelo_17927 [Pelomyxa schiedti]